MAASLAPIAYDHANPASVRCLAVVGMILLPLAHYTYRLIGKLIDLPDVLTRTARIAWTALIQKLSARSRPSTRPASPSSPEKP